MTDKAIGKKNDLNFEPTPCKTPDERESRIKELHLFKSIVESSGEAIAVSDPAGRLIYINPAHEKLFGRTLADARNLNYRDYYPPESVAVLEKVVVPALARGEGWEGELDVYDAKGRRFPLWERADTVCDEKGRMLYGFGIMHDVTDRRRDEMLLQQRTNTLGERVKELNCLFAISRLIDRPNATLNSIVKGILEIIPPAWQYPDITWARILIKEQIYQTDNCKPTIWKQTCPIMVRNKEVGQVEVGYLEERPHSIEGPFLAEERLLINTIAERLGKIIERFQAELALRESEERYRSLYEQASDGIFLFDDNEIIFDANPKILETLGYRLDEVIGVKVLDLIHPEDLERLPSQINRLLAGEIVRVERRLRCKNGQYVTFEQSVRRIKENTILSFYRDITERKQAEDKIRMLSHQLLSAQEEERRMLSRELHDRLAQDLSASKIACDMIGQALRSENHDQTAALAMVSQTLGKTIQAVRDLSYEMRPLELSEIGLIETIDNYCHEFGLKNDLVIDFQTAGMEHQPVGPDAAINIFRLIQEGLNNINKHAGASRACIRLVMAYPRIVLRIEDNGIGFDVEKRLKDIVREKRMGLSSMQERVNLLGGHMRIRSEPQKGTRISIKLPIPETAPIPFRDRRDFYPS